MIDLALFDNSNPGSRTDLLAHVDQYVTNGSRVYRVEFVEAWMVDGWLAMPISAQSDIGYVLMSDVVTGDTVADYDHLNGYRLLGADETVYLDTYGNVVDLNSEGYFA